MGKAIVIRRLKAFGIDYLIILFYIAILFVLSVLVTKIFSLDAQKLGPVAGQLLGFFTLTLPVILYFSISENSSQAGTFGKIKMQLQVKSSNYEKAKIGQLLIRNILKFLPWELAHFFIFRLLYANQFTAHPPNWIVTGLFCAQGIALLYLIGLVFTRQHRSIYEWLSNTRVVQMNTA